MIKYRNNNIGEFNFGEQSTGKIYLGNTLVYESLPHLPVFYDRLIFDGEAYIDTDYVLPSLCSIRVSLGNEFNKASQIVFLVGNATDGLLGLIYGGNTDTSERQIVPYYDSTSYLLARQYLSFSSYPTFDYYMTPSLCGYAEGQGAYARGRNHPNDGLVFGTNTAHTGNPYSGTMGIFYVYGSDAQDVTSYSDFSSFTPAATFRPCFYNGQAGMWHVEEGKFYGNTAGSGSLEVAALG